MTETISTKEQNRKEFFSIMRELLNSSYAMLCISLLIVLGWALGFPYISIFMLLLFEIGVFIFCSDNPKACLLPIISISYMITTIHNSLFTWIYFILVIAIAVITIGSFILVQVIKNGKKLKRGKMWWAFALAALGNILGGIIGHFEFLTFVIVIAFSLLIYAIYWFCINFISDYKEYFAKVLIFFALIISLEVFIAYLRVDDLMYALENKVIIIGTGGTGEANAGAIFMLFGVMGCFYLAQNSKKDYLYILLAFLFDIVIFFTHCRIALFLCAVLSVIYFFIIAKNSPNKKYLYIGAISALVVAGILFAIFYDKIIGVISYYIEKGFGGNGRNATWGWSWKQFLSSPIFGIGFITRDPYVLSGGVPGLLDFGGWALVSTHNSILHFLACTGVVGLLLNLPFYIKKYLAVFKNFSQYKLYVLFSYICTFVVAFFDPTPMNNPFYVFISVILIAFVEKDNDECVSLSGSKNTVNTKISISSKTKNKNGNDTMENSNNNLINLKTGVIVAERNNKGENDENTSDNVVVKNNDETVLSDATKDFEIDKPQKKNLTEKSDSSKKRKNTNIEENKGEGKKNTRKKSTLKNK